MGLGKTYSADYLVDSNNNTGAVGEVLVSTATGINWADGSDIAGGPYLPLAGGTITGNVRLNDNVQLQIGSSNDAYITHNGTHTYFVSGVGDLYLQSNNDDIVIQAYDDLFLYTNNGVDAIIARGGAAVELYHNNVKKLETTSTGVEVTGKITNLTAGTGNLDAVNVQQLNDATTGALIFKGTWSASPTTTSTTSAAVSSSTTVVISSSNTGISVGATITGTGISGTVTVSNIAADGITLTISSAQSIASGVTLTFTTVGGTPDLSQTARKVTGDYYICETAGVATPNGTGATPDDWAVGDWVAFSDLATDAWQKIDNSSVLSGAGTGGKVPVWSGSGTSVTLADAPITVSGNNATFAGTISASGSTAAGVLTLKSTAASDLTISTSAANTWEFNNSGNNSVYNGYSHTFKNGSTTGLTINNSGNSTFAGNVTLNGDGKLLKFTPTSYDDVELGIDSNGFVIYNTTDARYDLKISGTGNATFAGEVTATDDINALTKIVVGENATAEVRIKKTNTGNAKLSFYNNDDTSSAQQAYLSLDANEDLVMYSAANNNNIFYAGGALNLIMSGANATFAGTINSGAITALAKGAQFDSTGYYVNSTFKDVADNCGVILGHNDTANGVGVIAGINQLAFLTYGSAWTQALLLDASQNATFAGNIDAGAAGKLSFTGTSGSPDLIIKNNSAASSTSGTATLQFKQALNSAGGKIVSGRDADYSTGTTRDSHLKFYTSKDATDTLALTLNSSQNAGIGVTPEANIVSYIKQLRLGEQSALQGHADGVGQDSATWLTTNITFTSTGGKFINGTVANPGYAQQYQQQFGDHSFATSNATGVAGGAVTLTQQMVIKQNGNVGIGYTTPSDFTSVGADNLVIGPLSGNNGITVNSATTGYGALAFADGTGASDQYRGLIQYNHTADSLAIFTNATTKMTVLNDGNVGIGATAPEKKLHIKGTTNDSTPQVLVQNSGTGDASVLLNVSGQSYVVGIDYDDSKKFKIASSSNLGTNDRITLLSTGQVGIGTITPSQKLHVTGNARVTGKYYDSNNNAGLEGQVLKTKVVEGSTTGTDWEFVNWTPDIWQVNPTTSALTAAATLVCDTVKEFEGTTQTSGAGAGAGEIRILDAGFYEINYSVAINVTDTNVSTRQVVALYLTAHPINGSEIKIPGSLNSTYLRLPGTNQGGGTSFSNTAYYMVPANTDIALKIDWIDGNTKSVNIVQPFAIQNTIAIKRIGDFVDDE